jgi:hypothetical protein
VRSHSVSIGRPPRAAASPAWYSSWRSRLSSRSASAVLPSAALAAERRGHRPPGEVQRRLGLRLPGNLRLRADIREDLQ